MANGRSTPWPENMGNRWKSGTGPRAANSGNDVGGELVFDLDDAITQMQLAFLQALHLQQVRSWRVVQRFDGNIEIAMLLAQLPELSPQFAFVILLHRCCRTEGLMGHAGGGPGRRRRA